MPKHRASASPEETFFLTLQKTTSLLQKSADSILRPIGLTVAEYMLLRVIENIPGITARDAALHLDARAPTIAQLVSQLESRQLLERIRDPKDARRLPLRLSGRGRKIVILAKRAVSEWISDMQHSPRLLQALTQNLLTFLSSLPSHGKR